MITGGVAYWCSGRGHSSGRGRFWFSFLGIFSVFGWKFRRLGDDFNHPAQHPGRDEEPSPDRYESIAGR